MEQALELLTMAMDVTDKAGALRCGCVLLRVLWAVLSGHFVIACYTCDRAASRLLSFVCFVRALARDRLSAQAASKAAAARQKLANDKHKQTHEERMEVCAPLPFSFCFAPLVNE